MIRGMDLILELERDMSVCTYREVQKRWSEGDRALVIAALSRDLRREVSWASAVPADHNPIYYTSERAFFGNKRAKGNPRFLHPPLHRDRYCKPVMEHILDPVGDHAALVWLGFRDGFKSTFTHGATPMWFAHRMRRLKGYDARIVLRHHKEDIAAGNLVRLKNKYRFDPWTRRVWHDACPRENAREFGTTTAFTLPWASLGDQAEVTFRAIGVNAVDTGLHSDLDCGDDLETEDHLASRKIRKDAQMRYDARRFQLDPEGREMNTGTPYHPAGLWTWMENAVDDDGVPLYRFIRVPAIAETCPDCKHPTVDDVQGGPNHIRGGKCTECGCTSDAALAHPQRLPWRILNQRRKQEMGRSHNDMLWRRQYQVQMRAASDVVGDSKWLREAALDDVPDGAWPVFPLDPAFKGTENHGEGDAAAGQQWLLARRGGVILRYLVDGFHSREMSPNDGVEETFRIVQRWGGRAIAPEEHGGRELRQKLADFGTSIGYPVSIIDLKLKQTAKWQRMLAFLREAEKGTVFVVTETCPAEVLQALRDQMDGYHPDMDDDDALDCAGYSLDPNITRSWAPAWNSGQRKAMQKPRRVEAPRTRHCAL